MRIEHFAIAAKNTQKLSLWYARAAGFRITHTIDNGAERPATYMLQLRPGDPYIEIFPADGALAGRERSNPEPGFAHFAVAVEDFDAAKRSFIAAGAIAEGEERAAPFKSRVQFFRDPEGNLFHIVWRPQALSPDA